MMNIKYKFLSILLIISTITYSLIQVIIPNKINEILLSNEISDQYFSLIFMLSCMLLLKLLFSNFSFGVASYIKASTITYIVRKMYLNNNSHNAQYTTLIREDANSFSDISIFIENIIASGIIFSITFYTLFQSNLIIGLIFISVFSLIFIYAYKLGNSYRKRYSEFLSSDENYKSKIIKYLYKESDENPEVSLKMNSKKIKKFDMAQQIFFFIPSIFFFIVTMLIIVYYLIYDFDFLKNNIIIIIAYLGMLNMSTTSIINNYFNITRIKENYYRLKEYL